MKKKIIIGLVLMLVMLIFSTGYTTEGGGDLYKSVNPIFIKLIYYNDSYNEDINTPSIIEHDTGRNFLLYEFTCEGLRKAFNFSNGKNHIIIDFPNGTMNVSGQHFKNSIFYVNGSNLRIIGKGYNIVTSAYYKVARILGDYVYLIPKHLKWILEGIKEHKRSGEDTVFIVDNITDDMSVFCFEGDNITVSGLNVVFNQNTSAIACYSSGDYGYFFDLYVEERY